MSCIFCKIIAGEIPSEILYRDEQVLAFRDINPQAPVHILVIPVKHIETVLDLTENEDKLTGKMVRIANQLAGKEGIAENGFRLLFNCRKHGGQDVYHIHLHLVGGRQMKWPPG